ncbi:histidine phosphatase family protein [Candidatus Parcubacteria bacterium]|nr:histidine phosphatase family protein [Candidatus Parcubacteria bacterium]
MKTLTNVLQEVMRVVGSAKEEILATMDLGEELEKPLSAEYFSLLSKKIQEGVIVKRLAFGTKAEFEAFNKKSDERNEGLIMSRELIVMRHLMTEDNTANRFCSGDRDISIIPGQTIGPHIIQEIQKRTAYILGCTGLKRTQQTVQLLQQQLCYKGELVVLPEFKERIGGELAGLPFSDIQRFFPQLKTPNELWEIEASEFGLENVKSFLHRIEEGMQKIYKFQKTIILVAHAGSIKGMRAISTAKTEEENIKILCATTPNHTDIYAFRINQMKGELKCAITPIDI